MAQAEVLRLKTRSQFQAVLREGSVVGRSTHFALHRLDLPLAASDAPALFATRDAWIGAMVPKRWARRAVTRNLIKRQIYAVSQQHEPCLEQAAHVLRLRGSFDRAKFPSAASATLRMAVHDELQGLLAKLKRAPGVSAGTPESR